MSTALLLCQSHARLPPLLFPLNACNRYVWILCAANWFHVWSDSRRSGRLLISSGFAFALTVASNDQETVQVLQMISCMREGNQVHWKRVEMTRSSLTTFLYQMVLWPSLRSQPQIDCLLPRPLQSCGLQVTHIASLLREQRCCSFSRCVVTKLVIVVWWWHSVWFICQFSAVSTRFPSKSWVSRRQTWILAIGC